MIMMTMTTTEQTVIDFGNSFTTSRDSMKTGDVFDEIILSCQFPETVPFTYVKLLNGWVEGHLYDAVFLDFVSWYSPTLVEVTKCLISAYAGGLI